MTEVFRPRENMTREHRYGRWECRDQNDNFVCDGGPSVIWDKGRGWYFWHHDKGYHRLDGPAISNGAWLINNKNVTREIHIFTKENDIDLDNLSNEDKVLIALKFG